MNVVIPGYGNIIGNPLLIIKLMQQGLYFEGKDSADQYTLHSKENIKKILEKDIQFCGEKDKDRAVSFLHSLHENGLITILEDNL